MKKSNAQKMKPVIEKFFDELPFQILKHSELAGILADKRTTWNLPRSMKAGDFINFLASETKLRSIAIAFPSRKEVRYLWGEVPLYSVIMSLRPGGYLSHYTAMYFLDLTDQAPQTIYLNCEQPPPSRRDTHLDQSAIDLAFSRKERVSHNIAVYEGYKIRLINSMGTGGLGVVEMSGPQGEKIRVTNIERTLIDIAVRPSYSGGTYEVLEAYRRSRDLLSLNRLAATLKQMKYIYPYHQVIGFYLDRAGLYDETDIKSFLDFGFDYDFYLVHGMKETEREYSDKWRLFYPKGF